MRITMLFCFILISNLAVQGQNYFNIKLGLVLADQTNTNGSFRAGLNTGFTYDYKVAPSIWIQSGLEYAGRGTNLGVVNNVTQFKTNIKYIEVPIFVKYKYSFKPSINWAIYGGPSVAFAVDASSSFFRIAQPATIPLPIGEGGVSRTDLAINIGGELDFATEYGYFSLYTTYQRGLTTVFEDINGNNISNQGIAMGLIFKFGKNLWDQIAAKQNK